MGGGGGGGGGGSERTEKAKTGRISWQYMKHVKLYCLIYCRFYKENLKIPKLNSTFIVPPNWESFSCCCFCFIFVVMGGGGGGK